MTLAMKTLAIARAPGAARLWTAEGAAIWPYSDAAGRAALVSLAKLFGTSVAEAQPHPAPVKIAASFRAGVVVSLHEDADAVAMLYAHLTGRRAMAAWRDGDQIAQQRTDIVVGPRDMLTPNLLARLYSDADWAPGLITGGSPQDMLRQALLRAGALALCGSPSHRRVDIRPFADHGEIETEDWRVLGQRADPARLARALGEDSALLTVFTVGDGVDAGFGPLTLCSVAGSGAAPDENSPACVKSGTCHRLQLPLAEALSSGKLVSPEQFSARVLVLHACWGIQPAGSLFGLGWGYGHRLADHARIGAMLTTWRITVGASGDTDSLVRDVARGMAIGRALARFNEAEPSRRTGQRMCLLGDPELRISAIAPPAGAPHARPNVALEDHEQLLFLRAYLDTVPPKRECRQALVTAREAVVECLRATWSGASIDAHPESPGMTMRAAMVRFLCLHATMPAYHWIDLAAPARYDEEGGACATCGQTTCEAHFRLRTHATDSRLLQFCPRCGMTEDRSLSMPTLRLAIDGESIRLHGTLPRGPWAAGLLLRPLVGKPVWRRWPEGENGDPITEMSIAGRGWPRGAGQALLLMVESASLRMARGQYGYGPPAGSAHHAFVTMR